MIHEVSQTEETSIEDVNPILTDRKSSNPLKSTNKRSNSTSNLAST